MSSVLASIIEGVREDEARRRISTSELEERIASAAPPRDALASLRSKNFSIIAEVKRSSPSKGALADIANPEELAHTYEKAGASVVSVLTEERRFGGSLKDLTAVREKISLPILRKDFMVSDYLIKETRAFGADVVLLIVAALDDYQLRDFHSLADELGMDVLVEVHDEFELERALTISPEIVGINSRNLKTLEVDLSAFERLIPLIPGEIHSIAESGILTLDDANRALRAGADTILVGEMLVRAIDPASQIVDLLALS